MAKFSAAHYVILERALHKAYADCKAGVFDLDRRERVLAAIETCARIIALELSEDNNKFDQKQFLDVVKGLRPVPRRIR